MLQRQRPDVVPADAPAHVTAVEDSLAPREVSIEWLASVAILALAAVLVTLHTLAYPVISPIDELQHIDYLYRAADFEVVRSGDRVGAEVFSELARRGTDASGFTAGYYNTASVHPPTYYWVTAQAARLVQAGSGIDSLVTAGRLIGAAWLGAGLILLWHGARALGGGRLATAGVVGVVGSSPGLLHATSTVNPDATALPAGALALLALVCWEQGRRGAIWLLFAAGLASTGFKYTNAVVVLLVATYLTWRVLVPSARGRVAAVTAATAIGAGALVPLVAWSVTSAAIARVDNAELTASEQFAVDSLSFVDIASNTQQFLTPLTGSFVPDLLRAQPEIVTARTLGGLLVVLGAFGLLLLSTTRGPLDRFASALVAVLLLAPPLLVLVTFVQYGAYFPIPGRYGLALVPALAAVLAAVARTTRAGWLLAGCGGLSVAAVGTALLRLAA